MLKTSLCVIACALALGLLTACKSRAVATDAPAAAVAGIELREPRPGLYTAGQPAPDSVSRRGEWCRVTATGRRWLVGTGGRGGARNGGIESRRRPMPHRRPRPLLRERWQRRWPVPYIAPAQ